jgi:phosphoesterase RecJ-like protein
LTGDALRRAAELLGGPGPVALACHGWPDGDALGSMLALHQLCLSHGKEAVASWPEPDRVGPHYRFLPGLDRVTKAADFPAHPDVMVTFDCGSLDRLGALAGPARRARELVVIDHHATNTGYGTVNLLDPEAAATAVVVRRLAAELGWELDSEAAVCLYTGLVSDTGRFQYSNTTPEVFALAEELSRFGLPIAEMNRELFEKSRFAYLQMAGEVLARAELDRDKGLVLAWVTRQDLERHGVVFEEAEGLIDLLRRTAEAEVAAVAKEADEDVRVSLRSTGSTDVGRLAQSLGGGGHRFAAGYARRAPLPAVLAELREALSAPRP